MRWTIFKLMLLVLLLAWLATLSGRVDIYWSQWQISTRSGVFLIVLLSLTTLLWFAITTTREILSLPHSFSLWRSSRRRSSGYRSLLAALCAEPGTAALDYALTARKLLGNDALSTLSAAQIAESAEVIDDAEKFYKDLRKHEKTRPIALLSLSRLSRHRGDFVQAKKYTQEYARQAKSLQRDSLQFHIEQLKIAHHLDSPQALLSMLESIDAASDKLPAKFQKLEASLRLDAMHAAIRVDDKREALRQAERAYRASAALAIEHYTRLLALGSASDKVKGRNIIVSRWRDFEGHSLAKNFLRLSGTNKAIERVRLIEVLIGKSPSLKSRLLLCEYLLDAKIWGRAKQILDAASTELDVESPPHLEFLSYLRLQARLARDGDNDLAMQQQWLDRLVEHAQSSYDRPSHVQLQG